MTVGGMGFIPERLLMMMMISIIICGKYKIQNIYIIFTHIYYYSIVYGMLPFVRYIMLVTPKSSLQPMIDWQPEGLGPRQQGFSV